LPSASALGMLLESWVYWSKVSLSRMVRIRVVSMKILRRSVPLLLEKGIATKNFSVAVPVGMMRVCWIEAVALTAPNHAHHLPE
jgi:hypothetical protein